LTRNDSGWRWGEAEHTAFARLNGSITSAPVLISPNPTKPFRTEANSSDFVTGAVLSQVSSEDEKWHPVAFLSKSLSPVEQNYEIHNKEMLAIIRASKNGGTLSRAQNISARSGQTTSAWSTS